MKRIPVFLNHFGSSGALFLDEISNLGLLMQAKFTFCKSRHTLLKKGLALWDRNLKTPTHYYSKQFRYQFSPMPLNMVPGTPYLILKNQPKEKEDAAIYFKKCQTTYVHPINLLRFSESIHLFLSSPIGKEKTLPNSHLIVPKGMSELKSGGTF